MSFNGNESSPIDLTDAEAWTENYRNSVTPGTTKAHFFGKNKLMTILNQTGCMGIRAYYAIDNNGDKQLVLVGANADEQDMYEGVILDRATPCPTSCDQNSPLNS